MKYVKVMFRTTSGVDKNLEYRLNEVNVASNWNPTAKKKVRISEDLIIQQKIAY